MSEFYIPSVWNTLGRAGKWIIKKKTNTSMSTVMKNIMIITNTVITSISTMNIMNMNTMDTAITIITIITNIATMNIAAVGMTMKKKIAVCVDTITMGTVMMNITTTVPAAMTTTNMTTADTIITGIVMMTIMNIALADTIIQAVAVNIITAPQKRW
ncbi:MAG TPA: hypothetical protein DHV15_11705 [Treponema sp.]|uniref:Uncharacterized protein n=1 Tax=Treponema denticola (strain ATCC 35405 / DSM 14222 / CIP 103919 / JCM 8153 / KCTC 15104) TaxID=243275 RepID=Q73MX3_TREDE|nr:hypothetical protein TDE_1383 [Treponema denticola ATCC 35405]HCY96151.1 hypothetical protein [Treponema sp.]